MSYEIEVYCPYPKFHLVGIANSFGEAKRMQRDALPQDLRDTYAGIHEGMPLFYTDSLTPELLEKYPSIGKNEDSQPDERNTKGPGHYGPNGQLTTIAAALASV